VACLLARKGEPLLLSRLQVKQELMKQYGDLLPQMPADQWRRIRGEQEIIVRYAPDEALATLPRLLRDEADRARLVTLMRSLLGDERVRRASPSSEQMSMLENIGEALAVAVPRTARKAKASSRPARKPSTKPVSRPAAKTTRKSARKSARAGA
jgi:hypothetical protein